MKATLSHPLPLAGRDEQSSHWEGCGEGVQASAWPPSPASLARCDLYPAGGARRRRDCGAYFNSVITALAEPRTTSSVWMRSRLLKRISPDLYSFTTALPLGSVDCNGESSR